MLHRWLVPTLISAEPFVAEIGGRDPPTRRRSQHGEGRPRDGRPRSPAAAPRGSFVRRLPRGIPPDGSPQGSRSASSRRIPGLVDTVAGYLDAGLRQGSSSRSNPASISSQVRAVRRHLRAVICLFQVDANAAYTLADAPRLRRLDEFELLLIEQPLGEADLRQHGEARRPPSATPICLDESIVSAEAARGRDRPRRRRHSSTSGPDQRRRLSRSPTHHDLARAHGVAVWCGGMLETGLGRAANTALAALPGFTLPGDISGPTGSTPRTSPPNRSP